MTSVTASLPVGAQDSKTSSQDAPGRLYDDGMYYPGNVRLAVVADPSNELGNRETKPIKAADAVVDEQGSTEPGMLCGTITDTLPDPKAAAVKPAALPSEVPLDLRQGHFDHPLQLVTTMTTSTTTSSSTTSSTTSYNSAIHVALHTPSMPTFPQPSSTTSASHSASTTASAVLHWEKMTPGARAGILISAVSVAIILIGMIFWWLHRKKRTLLRAIRGEEAPPPTEKPNPAYGFASNLHTSSTSTLVNVTEIFKASREKSPSINDRRSSIYSTNQTRSNLFTLAADKISPLRGKKEPPGRRSRYSHGYIFAQEFKHVPPPPPPTRLQKIVAGLYANGSSTVKTVTAPFKTQAPPPRKDNASSTWSSMSSRTPYARAYDSYPHPHRFQPPCDISDDLDLVKVRSVSSGTVAMSNPAEIGVDALAGRISGEGKRHQDGVRESSPSPSQSSTAPCQRQSPPPETSREGSPAHSVRAPSHTQLEVPSVKLWTKQVYRVEMDFTPRSDGQLQVGEGQMVRLEQIFDDGWALCALTNTEKQGLLPRACLSTWPIKERRHYASSSNTSERALGISPTDSQSFRFYRQQSRSGSPKPATESKPPSVKKQSISPTLSTFFRV
ncbi:hypothetical protein Aspvir_007480 [Aspergillus viridinutans]|uniref:SH3 domain-containing protein n=1 Tax=Aspergillus viridinutans TaxID=75553 RepID=A0A9P3C1D5_ASPVI|nr:uncharacterized protein Aspvir_007480 [Aspergillus viridinutans]GIK03411.1 hypothetical protein Aspvir_007480 [Aspergillus viridinutans]